MIQLGDLIVILDLHRQGLSISAIARQTGRDPKTVRKYIARGLEPPAYGPRQAGRPSKLAPYLDYLRERVAAFPELSAVRLHREIRERGYTGAYTAVKRFVAAIRPDHGPRPFEVRFETPAGQQAQVDFARFVTEFTDEPGVTRIVWLFSIVLGHSRFIFARYVMHQDLQTLLSATCRRLRSLGGVPIEILYDRMKTAVMGEDGVGHIVYNSSLLSLARHYGFLPRACRPYRAKTKGKVERPFSYIRQDFFLARTFRNLDDLNAQLDDWLATVANVRHHGTTQRIVAEAFAAEQGDTAYGAADNPGWLVDEKDIAPHIPVIYKSQRDDGTFSREDFIYDDARSRQCDCILNRQLYRWKFLRRSARSVIMRLFTRSASDKLAPLRLQRLNEEAHPAWRLHQRCRT